MEHTLRIFISITLFLVSFSAKATINVVATLPELAWVANEIGKEQVKTISLLNGAEDPHYVDASPSFVFKVSKADVFIFNGLDLETGWLPKVMQMSGNAKVQRGESGLCNASEKVAALEKVANYDRSQGDIHPNGNPHYTISPKAMIKVGEQIKGCLEKASGKKFDKNFNSFKSKMEKLSKEMAKTLAPLKGKNFMVYHREFSYFFSEFGLVNAGSLEEVPGVLPSASYLVKVAKKAKENNALLALASSVSPKSYLKKFKEISGIDFLMLQLHSAPEEDYVKFANKLAEKISERAK